MFNSYSGAQSYCYWSQSELRTNLNGSLFYNNTAKLPTNMKARVIDKEVNAAYVVYDANIYPGGTNKSTDKVWLLTATEIGCKTVSPTLDDWWGSTGAISALNLSGDDGDPYDYFLDDVNKRKSTSQGGRIAGSYSYMWLATGRWDRGYSSAIALFVYADGGFGNNFVKYSAGVVPAVRVQ